MNAVLGAVLAGGSGARMGRGKATLELAGRPLISYPLAALIEARLETVVVAKRDSELPDLPVPLVLPSMGGRLHPLLARYGPALLDPLERALEERRPLQETTAQLGPVILDERDLAAYGDPERLLFNVNTPHDLARAEDLLRAGGG